MKVVILAGGLGTRISEETHIRPKPMIEIGHKPILWHIMKLYSYYGFSDFVVCCGYKGYVIKEYFSNYFLHMSDVTFDMGKNEMFVHQRYAEPWKVTLVDTGVETMTGGRIKKIASYVRDEEAFCLTYGDGLSDVDIAALVTFHKEQKVRATLTAMLPPARFGVLAMEGDRVCSFKEKPKSDGHFISGGFFVLKPSIIDLIEDDNTIFERDPLETLARNGELSAFRHTGFWQPMDTLRDKLFLNSLWSEGKAPWKLWS